jgi:hypothetical protein
MTANCNAGTEPGLTCKTNSGKNSTQIKKLLLPRYLPVDLKLKDAFPALNKILIRNPSWP